MPCVFPILSIKAFSISKTSLQGSAYIKSDGVFYTLGVIFCFLIIGGLLLVIKASGLAIGWGFQMQSPTFIAILVYLFFVIGLNLSGFFDITISFNSGQNIANRKDLFGSFFTGALATIIATPCTAPFMATALGVALTLPTVQALTVFLFLGFGLAFPYLLLTHFPPLIKMLPKPGIWTETFKQFLSFPIYMTALIMLSVLGKQTNIDVMLNVVMGLLATTFGIWLYQHTTKWNNFWRVTISALILVLSLYPIIDAKNYRNDVNDNYKKFSIAEIDKSINKGIPLLVAAGADWCATCKINERTTLNTSIFKNFIQEQGIKLIKADWTSSNPEITKWLARFNRSGVPLYVYYPVGKEPIVLPQLLTNQIVIDYLSN